MLLYSCDIFNQSSELLKQDFSKLLDYIMVHSRWVFIRGPIPPLTCSVGRFSRMLRFHTWLKLTYAARNIVFIDNFNLFWKHLAFFRPNAVHPKGLGSSTLTDNIFYSIWTSPSH